MLFGYVYPGASIGYVWAYREMLKTLLPLNQPCKSVDEKAHDAPNEARCLTSYYLNHQDRVALDHQQEIFSLVSFIVNPSYLNILPDGKVINHLGKGPTWLLHGSGGDPQIQYMEKQVEKAWNSRPKQTKVVRQ